jgi:hypothetical protein
VRNGSWQVHSTSTDVLGVAVAVAHLVPAAWTGAVLPAPGKDRGVRVERRLAIHRCHTARPRQTHRAYAERVHLRPADVTSIPAVTVPHAT